jgi:hypothetical protein
MINLDDFASRSTEELEKIVTERCSQFGSVSQVVIMRDSNHSYALALVVMSNPAEALVVLRELGDHLMKSIVVIRLE